MVGKFGNRMVTQVKVGHTLIASMFNLGEKPNQTPDVSISGFDALRAFSLKITHQTAVEMLAGQGLPGGNQ